MSKTKILIIVLMLILVAGTIIWLVKPKTKENFVEQEISIKQTEPVEVKTVTYQDSSGFSFEHPSDLKIQEVELDDKTVFSSLEITGNQPGKLSLKISDTNFKTLKDWQKEFEQKNIIMDVRGISFDDITGVEFTYTAPKLRKAVAIDNAIIYSLEAPADDGYWDKIQEGILNSFKFALPAGGATATNSGEITLIEEKYE
ncbi:MAG: PsbP-related protein [Candidatus Beckwithbacteria bacterium]|nr:PsbP-related protein [Candidatus Beckwithbacteria bacterium]